MDTPLNTLVRRIERLCRWKMGTRDLVEALRQSTSELISKKNSSSTLSSPWKNEGCIRRQMQRSPLEAPYTHPAPCLTCPGPRAKHNSELWKDITICYFSYNITIHVCLSTVFWSLSLLDDTWEAQKSFCRRIWVFWDTLLSYPLYGKTESPWKEVEVKQSLSGKGRTEWK